jgi:hypothetical protein
MKRTDVVLAVGMLATVLLAMVALAATGSLDGFFLWAWERHHNLLSWYIRPLFLLPLVYFSYRRNLSGIVLTLVALMISMFWVPAPEQADPTVEEFLAFEREWLTGGWTLAKILMTSLAPLSLAALCLAFWRRSLAWGLVIINAIAIGKVLWGAVSGEGTGWAMLIPAVGGLPSPPVPVRTLLRLRAVRDLPARIMAFGVWPVRVLDR